MWAGQGWTVKLEKWEHLLLFPAAYVVAHHTKGLFINHVDRNLDFYDPPLPPLWTILLNRAYVVIWTISKPPSHTATES